MIPHFSHTYVRALWARQMVVAVINFLGGLKLPSHKRKTFTPAQDLNLDLLAL